MFQLEILYNQEWPLNPFTFSDIRFVISFKKDVNSSSRDEITFLILTC